MARRLVQIFFVTVAALGIAAPGFQMLTSLFPPVVLHGVEENLPAPKLTRRTLHAGTFQGDCERWFAANIGFRGFFVKTDNQFSFSLFHELPEARSEGTRVVVGRRDVLFEWGYLAPYLDARIPTQVTVDAVVSKLATLQALLAQRRVQMLFVVSPSKVALYPEYLPRRYTRKGVDPSPAIYRMAMPLLENAGINVIDTPRILKHVKREGKYPVFPLRGTHWSEYASAVVCQSVAVRLQELLGKPLMPIRVKPVTYSDTPLFYDKDLLDLANLWFPQTLYERLPYPPAPRENDLRQLDQVYRPRVLMVGSSFTTPLVRHLDSFKVTSEIDFFYYFKSCESYPSGKKWDIDPQRLDWDREVFSHDVIVLEVNQFFIDQVGFGFVDAALNQLRPQA